jgi:hypothetical protein
MKNLAFIIVLLANVAFAQQPIQTRPKDGRYSAQADSLRKKHQNKENSDTVKKAQPDKMPVSKPDTNGASIPAAVPKSNDKMPTLELSDTLK